MPHQRPRRILATFKKRLKLAPVIGLVGARQTGKSTFLREILAKDTPVRYLTLDRREVRLQAERAPAQFLRLEQPEGSILCIDEAQKVPDLFDEIKAEIDEERRPGRYILSGSVEFSKKARIRESLTGRILTLQMYPMSIDELFPDNVKNLKDTQLRTAVHQGGLPGICFVRDAGARDALFQGWLETLIYKDLLTFEIPRFDPDRAYQILEACAQLHLPSLTDLSRHLELDPRRVRQYIDAFRAVFVLYEIPPMRGVPGKARYCLFDSGLATYLGAALTTSVLIRFINDLLSSFEARGLKRPILQSYRTPKGAHLDLIIQQKSRHVAVLVRESDQIHDFALRAPAAFVKKYRSSKAIILTPSTERLHPSAGIEVTPWTRIPQLILEFE